MLPVLILEAAILLGIVLLLLRKNPLSSISSSLRVLGNGLGRLTTTSEQVDADIRSGIEDVRSHLATGLGQAHSDIITSFDQMRRDSNELREMLALKLERAGSDATSRHAAFIENTHAKLAAIGQMLSDGQSRQSDETLRMKETVESTLSQLGRDLREGAHQLTEEVRTRLKEVTEQMNALSDANERRQEGLRHAVENRLEKLQENNSSKLEEMRATVDEKLHATLEKRLGDSFSLVTERLENVQNGLGQMKELAIGVDGLKRVLTDVRVRGSLGEIQCGAQLDQVLSSDQYIRNAGLKEGSPECVEFAIRIPNGEKGEMLLPVDAKFPKEEWERLEAAMDRSSADEIAAARNDLANAVRGAAKRIAENFIDPPRTTAFALLYVPTEGLFAEVIRVPGLLDELQTQFRVSIAGPTNFIAILNSLQMGFRTVAIQRKGTEVWRILGAARIEFQKFGGLMSKVEKQVDSVQGTLKEIRGKTSAINRTLKDVNAPEMAPAEAAALLGFDEEATLPMAANQGQVLEMRGNASGEQP